MTTTQGCCLILPPEAPQGRADRVLTHLLENLDLFEAGLEALQDLGPLSRTQIQKAFKAGLIQRNGKALDQNTPLGPGDRLWVALIRPEIAQTLQPHKIPLAILYEDEDLLALNKACGQVVHPGSGTGQDTLVHGLLYHCRYDASDTLRPEPLALSTLGGPLRPGVVHRLDKETTGVILFAKSNQAYLSLIEQFQQRKIKKTYLALVKGHPRLEGGIFDGAIDRHPVQRQKMQVVSSGGRPAVTYWKCLKRFPCGASLIECRPHTGRTHQIRVHLSHARLPILGDITYGYTPLSTLPAPASRVLLHALNITFEHPSSGKPLTLEAPIPEDFKV